MPARSTMMPGRLLFGPTSRVVAGGGRGKTPLAGYATGLERRRVSPRGEPVRFFTKKNTSFSSARLRRAFETTITTRHRASLVTGVAREKHAGKRKEPETTASRCKEREVSRDVPFPRAPEGLDGVELALLHARGVPPPHDGHALSRVDLVRRDAVPVQVAAALDLVLLAVNFHGVRLHHLLDGLADVAQADVDPRLLDPALRRLAHCVEERVVHVVEGLGERAVDDPAVDLRPEVEFDDVIFIDDRGIPAVGGPVRGDVVLRTAGGKRDPGFESARLDELPDRVFQRLAHVDEFHAGLHPVVDVLPHLPVHLRALPDLVVHVLLQALQLAFLLRRLAPQVVVLVRLDLALGEDVVEEDGHRDGRGRGLARCAGSGRAASARLLLLLFLLLLLSPGGGGGVAAFLGVIPGLGGGDVLHLERFLHLRGGLGRVLSHDTWERTGRGRASGA